LYFQLFRDLDLNLLDYEKLEELSIKFGFNVNAMQSEKSLYHSLSVGSQDENLVNFIFLENFAFLSMVFFSYLPTGLTSYK
jgi:hypothetical protein